MLDVTGPADRMMAGVFEDQSKQLIAQIKAIDPCWVYYRLGPIDSVEGLRNEYNCFRFQRAVTLARVKDDYGPLQVETLRFVQERTESAYEEGLALQKTGKLKSLPSDPVALGNFIDGRVRYDLRLHYNQFDIDSAGRGPVRVNRREDDTSGTDLTYRRPDARVKDVAFDVTIAHKTLKTAQVRGFFNTDFQPSHYPPASAWSGPHLCHCSFGDQMMDTSSWPDPYRNPNPYIPASISEINDMLGSMILGAPTFIDKTGVFFDRNLESEFSRLVEAFAIIRKRLGEDRYAALIDLAARAKALFAADQDDTNGKTDEGRALLFEIEDVLRDARRSRVKAKRPDAHGEIAGD